MDNGESSYRRFISGDDSALGEIISSYKDGLILYLNSIVKDLNTAEELCEDAFVKLAVKKPHFRGGSSFKTFLYSIARNIAFDHLRRTRESVPIEDMELSDERFDLEAAYIKEERKIAVHRAMEKLSPDYAQVLWLTYFEELSNKEAAAVMKKNTHAIETLVYRARNALRSQLEKEGFQYENI